MDYRISVIIPVYKAEKYLAECIESILSQSLKEIEILLMEDGSPDRCAMICDEYARKYDNIRVFHLENGGPSRARNIGIQNAKGEYIGFVDSDDYINYNMFSCLYSEATMSKADMVMCSYNIVEGNKITKASMKYNLQYEGHEEITKGLLSLYYGSEKTGLYCVWNKLFNREMIMAAGIRFNEELIRAEDAWFVFDFLKVASRVRFINNEFYFYRQVKGSTMHIVQSDQYERSKAFYRKLLEENKQLGLPIDKDEFYCGFLYETIIYCRGILHSRTNVGINEILEDSFFKKACKYRKKLPIHVRLICAFEMIGSVKMINFLLELWR